MSVPVQVFNYKQLFTHAKITSSIKVDEISVNRDRQISMDRSQARFLWYPFLNDPESVHFDLREGFDEKFERWPVGMEEKLDIPFQWMMKKASPNADIQEEFGVDVVSNRGALRLICETPYSQKKSWKIVATKKNGVIYMYRQQVGVAHDAEPGSYGDKMCYFGHKFEQCVTVGYGQEKPDPNPFVCVNQDFRIIVKTELSKGGKKSFNILMAAEVDCIGKDDELIEIASAVGELGEKFWKFKSLPNYLQCKLVGVNSILIGCRTEEGVVNKIELYSMDDFRNNKTKYWEEDICCDFLHAVLSKIDTVLQNDTTCMVEYNGDKEDAMVKLVDTQEYPILNETFAEYFGLSE